jgi:hypothetical protein
MVNSLYYMQILQTGTSSKIAGYVGLIITKITFAQLKILSDIVK